MATGFDDGKLKQSVRASTADSGYSVKRTKEIVDKLEKENFTLKMKIHLMENKKGSAGKSEIDPFVDDGIVDLVVRNQALHDDLAEKQDLLTSALEAIEYLEHQKMITQKEYRAMLMAQKKQMLKVRHVKRSSDEII